MQQDEVKFVGVTDLNKDEQDTIKMLSTEYFEKIKRSVNELVSMTVLVKTHHTEGKRKKYSIHMKAAIPERTFTSTKASDWDVARTMHIAGKECLAQIEHALHVSDKGKAIKR